MIQKLLNQRASTPEYGGLLQAAKLKRMSDMLSRSLTLHHNKAGKMAKATCVVAAAKTYLSLMLTSLRVCSA